MSVDIQEIFRRTAILQKEIDATYLPPAEGKPSKKHGVIHEPIFKGSRSYIEKICHQVNSSYENGNYDACAVMCRRLLETLIIELFESKSIAHKIQKNGDFLYLRDLISSTVAEPTWNLGRNTKTALSKLKDIGDKSAHSRRFVAVRQDIDDIKNDLRTSVQELIFVSNLKN